MENIYAMNRENCDRVSVEAWAAWYEGEESWGFEDDDD